MCDRKHMSPLGTLGSSQLLPLILVLSSLLICPIVGVIALNGEARTDFQALSCLKIHLSPSSGLPASWKIDDTLQQFCSWSGVTCSKRHTSRVVALDLESLQLNGQIPSCIANLTLLTRIHLPNNQLWGPIPPELGQLNCLRYLNLSSNNLSGTIPSDLSSCSQLQIIDLGSNSIGGEIPTNLSDCSNIQQLNLGKNKLTGGIPEGLGTLRNLSVLRLTGNGLRGNIPLSLGSSSSLHSVHLTNNSLTGPIPSLLANSSSLQFLVLTNNHLGGEIPPALFTGISLRVLSLGLNNFTGFIPVVFPIINSPLQYLVLTSNNLAGTIPSTLGNFSSLCWLLLGDNSFQGSIPASIGKLPNLQVLDLSYNFLAGSVPASIYNISTLTYLGMGVNILAGEIPYNIGYTLPSIQTLILGMNKFHGQIPTSLANTTNLQEIYLGNNSFHGVVPSFGTLPNLIYLNLPENRLEAGDWSFLTSLTNCSQLIELSLSANILQGDLPSSIAELSKTLQVLMLGANKISGTIPQEIEHLTNLERLSIDNNLLSGSIPYALGNLEKLVGLGLSQNRLSGQIPLSIGNLSQLTDLYLQENKLSGPIPRTLGGCKILETLNLSHNIFDDSIPKELFTLSSLSIGLDLSHNKLSGQIPLEIGSLVNLGSLNISNNQLSGQIPSTMGECLHLESLHMEGNNFHGRIPQSFMNLRGIIVMDLSQNNLSGEIPDFFESFGYMRLLNLSFNNLEGPVPPGGMFQNDSEVFTQGNNKLCAQTPLLELPLCNAVISKKKLYTSKILKIVPITALSLVLLLCFGVIIRKKRKNVKQAAHPSVKEFKKFTYVDLVKATNGFSEANLVGSGTYGSVYKARIEFEEHHTVAIKVFKLDQFGATKSFLAECEALRNTRHRNLLRVITVCSTSDPTGNEFKALVLEFMANGDLESWLYPTLLHEHHPKRSLCLGSRIAISVGIAAALDYLHNQCMPPVVHCDLKPSNVLLDDLMGARVGDFGLAKFLLGSSYSSGIDCSTSLVGPRGSVGYIAPEYGSGSKISMEGDVYSYGIIILEMLTRKRPTDEMFKDGLSLYKFVEDSFPEKICEILDSRVITPYYGNRYGQEAGSFSDQENHQMAAGIVSCITALTKLGLLCAAEMPKDRPTMQDVYSDATAIKEAFAALHG
ncbi:probable LRR receptor-like serine/threonine-protein kinase At3g47570 [Hordeum vulgare subsp. vulgare]|uniref:Receptor kinase-like protein Xa21 n=1 Tax=Hordeum vulgare subsp. vulgare TaxID=112509 RepID=A0A8I7B8F1_HORVV|nr:probable LRR receptor-like serine/threonine-protein kinase At3g47570 [Hordeum vulgare subsp. vulgare]